MQQLFGEALVPKWYFAFGAAEKTSLSIQYCRQNGFEYFSSPTIERLKSCQKNAIIEGTYQLFMELQKIKPELYIIFFGTDYSDARQKALRREYLSIGYCKNVPVLDHSACRRALYPNLIFVYGPIKEQNLAASATLAKNLNYTYSQVPQDPNNLIKSTNKNRNYIVNGLFSNSDHIRILEEYFNIRIIHFKYNSEDLPKQQKFFEQEYDLIPFLKTKPYYFQIKGDDPPVVIMDNVGIALCPKLIYLNSDRVQYENYVNQYIEQTDGVVLNIFYMQSIRKRKNLSLAKNIIQKIFTINQILYKDLSRKEIIFNDFPWHTYEFVNLENINRKFSHFVDFTKLSKYQYSKQYSSQIYFLENQTRICPSYDLPLKQQLSNINQYWVINGPGTCGKTSIAKYIASEFGFKLIEFQAEATAAKEKIASPEDGQEVPVKKYVAYFANILKNNSKSVCVFDSLPYNNNDLDLWIKEVGCPNVINLKVDPTDIIKRGRKKAEGDVNAEISEEETAKANQSIQKNSEWIDKLGQLAPSSKIYQVQYNLPQLLAEQYINSILKPRIFLVQRNNYLVYQNIAIKYDLGFINLIKTPLKQCLPLVKKCSKRDIILCYYEGQEEELVSENMYWIEKNLGEIRYVGIWQPQEIEIKESYMKLERPPAPVKPKPAQGEQQKQQEAAEGEQQGKAKKVFDIYEYQWTEPSKHKNLSQWYFKLKKSITKKTSNVKQCYESFGEVLYALNSDKNLNFYEIIKQ